MTPFYLKFSSASEAAAALTEAYGADDDGMTVRFSHEHAIDVVGQIEGATGYHVNLMAYDLPAGLAAFEIHPATPSRVFA